MSTCSRLLARVRALGLLTPLLMLPAAHAQIQPWTSAASAGTVDEADTGIVEFINGEARLKAAAPLASVLNLRYNVVALPGFNGLGPYALRARFLDNGASARVRLALTRYRIGFAPSVVHTLDSNTFAAQVGYQTQQDCIAVNWNFTDSVYYIEATLDKIGADAQSALATLQLIPTQCTP